MINLEIDHEIINRATTWESEGEKLALAIVVKTWGSSPRQPGSMMLIREDGHIIGSVSGGCVEGAVIFGSKNILQNNKRVYHTINLPILKCVLLLRCT